MVRAARSLADVAILVRAGRWLLLASDVVVRCLVSCDSRDNINTGAAFG
jgi:hypothetical protein